jgi:hypothetical protein
MNNKIPVGLRNALESGRSVLFVGAGIGKHARDPNGAPAPTADGLARELQEHFQLSAEEGTSLAKVAQYVEIRKGRQELLGYLSSRLRDLEPDDSVRWITTLRWKAIFTTNYDSIIERAYNAASAPQQRPLSIWSTSSMQGFDPRFQVPIIHLHGWLFSPDKPTALITDDDYATC